MRKVVGDTLVIGTGRVMNLSLFLAKVFKNQKFYSYLASCQEVDSKVIAYRLRYVVRTR